jgi:hypothetical protein
MSKIKLSVDEHGAVKTTSQKLWGESLWNSTVTAPHDVGCDHAFIDAADNVWVSTFRSGNAGIHMLDYNTGLLQYSIHGFTSFVPGEYSYPAGVHGFGSLFANNSMMALATSSEKMGVRTPPPCKPPLPYPWLLSMALGMQPAYPVHP